MALGCPFALGVRRSAIVERIKDHPLGDEPRTMRREFEGLIDIGSGLFPSRIVPIDDPFDGIECLPQRRLPFAPTIVHFHGGGYVFGSPETHARLAYELTQRLDARVFLPRYPLAPEATWPAPLNDALAACARLTGPIVLSGDSAGGHLALVTALELARRGTPVEGLVLFSPNTDRSGLSDTRERNDPLDPMVDDEGDRDLAKMCFNDMAFDHPQVSPVLDDLTLLPPLYVEAGAEEVLLGDTLVLAERTRAAGVDVTLHVEPHGLHMGQIWAPWWDVANASLDRAAAFVRSL